MAALAACPPAPLARQRMVERFLPLADGLARRYAHTTEPLDDLIQVARLGLLKAVDRWDPDRGTAFSSFAVPTITGELRRHFRDRTWSVKPPRDLQERYLRVQRTRSTLATELGREPTAADVAEAIGCDIEDVVEAVAVGHAYAPRSLDAPVSNEEEDGVTGVDRLADPRREIGRSEDATALRELGQVLDDRSWEVVRLRFQEDLLQHEIGERVGCSQMHVSRILRDALTRLRQAADDAGVDFAA
jgi:RNA polymerase sigma-B factor